MITQYILKTSINNPRANAVGWEKAVVVGWDRTLQYFMECDLIDPAGHSLLDNPLYSSLKDDINLDSCKFIRLAEELAIFRTGIPKDAIMYSYMTTIFHPFADKVHSFGVEIPEEMIARLQADKVLSLSNSTSTFNEDGVETKDM